MTSVVFEHAWNVVRYALLFLNVCDEMFREAVTFVSEILAEIDMEVVKYQILLIIVYDMTIENVVRTVVVEVVRGLLMMILTLAIIASVLVTIVALLLFTIVFVVARVLYGAQVDVKKIPIVAVMRFAVAWFMKNTDE